MALIEVGHMSGEIMVIKGQTLKVTPNARWSSGSRQPRLIIRDERDLKVGVLWASYSERAGKYLSGKLGDQRVLLFSSKYEGEDEYAFTVYFPDTAVPPYTSHGAAPPYTPPGAAAPKKEPEVPWWAYDLEVSWPTSEDQVKAAWRKMVFKYHPDHGGSQGDFVAVKKAYEAAMAYFKL